MQTWGTKRACRRREGWTSELLAGGTVERTEGIVFDLGVRWGLAGETPDATWLAGLTLAFEGFRRNPAETGSPYPRHPETDRR